MFRKLISNYERAPLYILLNFQVSHVILIQCGTKEETENTINCLSNYQDMSLLKAHKELKENQRNRTSIDLWGLGNRNRGGPKIIRGLLKETVAHGSRDFHFYI